MSEPTKAALVGAAFSAMLLMAAKIPSLKPSPISDAILYGLSLFCALAALIAAVSK